MDKKVPISKAIQTHNHVKNNNKELNVLTHKYKYVLHNLSSCKLKKILAYACDSF